MASPAAEQLPIDAFSGKRRWWHSADTNFYGFEEFLAHCEKEKFLKYEAEAQEKTPRGGAIYLWRGAYGEVHEAEVASRRAEQVRQLPPLPFEALKTGSSVAVMLQSVAPPPVLLGPSKGGGTLRVNKKGFADCWGGAGPRAALRVEVLQCSPTVVARIVSSTGMYLRAAAEGKVRWSWCADGGEDNEQASLFELLPRAFPSEEPLTVVSLMPKGGATCIGTFAVFAAPAYLTMYHVELETQQDHLEHLGQLARDIAQADPELRGRRRHKQDNKMRHYSFEDMVRWAAHKYHATKEQEALELGRAVWKFMCVDEESENNQAKRFRGSLDSSWNVVRGPAFEESPDVQM